MKIYQIIVFLIAINFISCEIVIESIEEIFCDSSELKFKITGSVPEEESPYGSQLTVKLSSPSNTNPSCSYFILGGGDVGPSSFIEISCVITSPVNDEMITVSQVKFDNTEANISTMDQETSRFTCGYSSDSGSDSGSGSGSSSGNDSGNDSGSGSGKFIQLSGYLLVFILFLF